MKNEEQLIWEAYREDKAPSKLSILANKISGDIKSRITPRDITGLKDIKYDIEEENFDNAEHLYNISVPLTDGRNVMYLTTGNIDYGHHPLGSIEYWDFQEIDNPQYSDEHYENEADRDQHLSRTPDERDRARNNRNDPEFH